MPIPSSAVKVTSLAGIELYYERTASGDPFGDLPEEEKHSVYMLPAFKSKLNLCFGELWAILGTPKGVITAGGYVDKPGAHGQARAFDLDGITWAPANVWRATQYQDRSEKRFYYALMCHFHLYFGNVLGEAYNSAHADHIHLDDLVMAGLRLNSRAIITTVQKSLEIIHDLDVTVDGIWGEETRDAFSTSTEMRGPYPSALEYNYFLKLTRDKVLRGHSSPIAPLSGRTATEAIALTRDYPTRLEQIEQLYVRLEERVTQLEKKA